MDDQSRAWYRFCEKITTDVNRLTEQFGSPHGHNMAALGLLDFAAQAAWGLIREDDDCALRNLSDLRLFAARLERQVETGETYEQIVLADYSEPETPDPAA